MNLERTNLGDLDRSIIPGVIDLVTIDVSFLSLTAAAPQLDRVALAPDADLVALVKPMFELRLPRPPEELEQLLQAVKQACAGIAAAGWQVLDWIESPVRGSRGAVEYLVHARRLSIP